MPQQAIIGPAPMEDVERTNVIVVRGSGARVRQNIGAPPRQNPYAMEIDRRRNCYTCGEFRHMARHCRNQEQRGRVVENRRIEYEDGRIEKIPNFVNNLKEEENLELLN